MIWRWLALTLLLVIGAPALAQQQVPNALSPGLPPLAVLNDSSTITIRELAAVIAERDRQYAQRFEAQQKAVDAALAAQDKATAAAFSAAEKAVAAALAAQEKATSAAFAAANTAVAKAEGANEKRLDGVNEFRGQLKDQASTFMLRQEGDVKFKAMGDKVEGLQNLVTAAEARGTGANNLWILLLGGFGLAAVLFGLVLKLTGAALTPSRRRAAAAES